MNATQLDKGQSAVITEISDRAHSLRLREMGFLDGSIICLTATGPFGSPLSFKVGFTHTALRKEEAEAIKVKPIDRAP